MATNINEPRRGIKAPRAGEPITESFLQKITNAVNELRTPGNPPSQVTTSHGGGGTGSIVVVARIATANIALTGTVSVDGANATNGTLVLAKSQTTAADRGVWLVNTSGAWTQQSPFQPTLVIATAGSTLINTLWYLSAANTYTAGVEVYG